MLLERRDVESGLALTGYPQLNYRQKRALLDDLSYWMIKNEWTQVTADSARDRLGKKLENLRTKTKDGPLRLKTFWVFSLREVPCFASR